MRARFSIGAQLPLKAVLLDLMLWDMDMSQRLHDIQMKPESARPQTPRAEGEMLADSFQLPHSHERCIGEILSGKEKHVPDTKALAGANQFVQVCLAVVGGDVVA